MVPVRSFVNIRSLGCFIHDYTSRRTPAGVSSRGDLLFREAEPKAGGEDTLSIYMWSSTTHLSLSFSLSLYIAPLFLSASLLRSLSSLSLFLSHSFSLFRRGETEKETEKERVLL